METVLRGLRSTEIVSSSVRSKQVFLPLVMSAEAVSEGCSGRFEGVFCGHSVAKNIKKMAIFTLSMHSSTS